MHIMNRFFRHFAIFFCTLTILVEFACVSQSRASDGEADAIFVHPFGGSGVATPDSFRAEVVVNPAMIKTNIGEVVVLPAELMAGTPIGEASLEVDRFKASALRLMFIHVLP